MPAMAEARVLVVDDDTNITDLVGTALRYEGFEVHLAHAGRAAIDAVTSFRPDLIVLDVMLPDLDGFEVCRRFKRDEVASRVPIIFLTAMDSETARRKGMECGAVDYLIKPFDPDRLLATIERHGHSKPALNNP